MNVIKTHILMLICSRQGCQRDKNLAKILLLIKGNVSKSSDFFEKIAKTFASFVHKLIVKTVRRSAAARLPQGSKFVTVAIYLLSSLPIHLLQLSFSQ